MQPIFSFVFIAALARACTIFPTRFDAQGNAWVNLPNGEPMTSMFSCSLRYRTSDPLFDPERTLGVYALSSGYLIAVDNRGYTEGDVDYFPVPKTDAEAQDLVKFNQHTAQFYLVNDGRTLNTAILHDNKSRLLSPIDRSIQVVADKAGRSGIPNVHSASCYLNTAIQLLYLIPTLRHRLADAVSQLNLQPATLSYQLNAIFFALENNRQPTPMMMHNLIQSLSLRHAGVIVNNRVEQFDSAEAIKYLIMDIEAEIQTHLPLGSPWFFRNLLYTRHDRLDFDENGFRVNEESIDAAGLDLYQVDKTLITSGAEIPIETLIRDTYADAVHGQGHTHSHRIYDLPTYMFIKFPRFGNAGRVLNNISMPTLLPLDNLVSGKVPNAGYYDYELIGVGLHSGGNYNGGHYTAMVKGDDNAWRTMDDSGVSLSGPSAPQGDNYSSKQSTVALYRRVLRDPEAFTNSPLHPRPGLDLNTLLANKASPPAMKGNSKPSTSKPSTNAPSSTSNSSPKYSDSSRTSGGGSSGSSKSTSPAPAPTPSPLCTPRPSSASALSVSTFLYGSSAVIAALLI